MTIKNTKRSGGPKTAAGKLVASQNSLKTGTYSNVAVLPHEDQEEFNLLVDQFNRDFAPKDVIEISLVRELAVITWKKLRLEKLEQGYFLKKLNAPILQEDFEDSGLKFTDERFKFWSDEVKLNDEQLTKSIDTLKAIRPFSQQNITLSQLLDLKDSYPYAYETLENAFRQYEPLETEAPSIDDLMDKTLKLKDKPEGFFLKMAFERMVVLYEASIWCTQHEDDINNAIAQVKQERLLKLMQSDDGRRANDDLSRSLMRILSEFRKHNNWRINNSLFGVDNI
jgi:hypothetical protein